MQIVVGVDGSEAAHKALQWAAAEAKSHKAGLTVLHAWSYMPPMTSALPNPPIPMETLEEAARAVLDEAVSSIDTNDVTVESKLVIGGAAQSLIAEAKGADMLVVGSRGHGGFAGLLLGSVSQQLTHHAPCPVVIVPENPE